MKIINDSAAARRPRTAFKVAFIYILVSGIWILASDRLLEALVTDHALYANLSILKGWLFVAVTAVLLYGLIERDARQQWYTNVALRESETRFRTIIENIPLGVGVSDLTKNDGPILYTNDKYVEMFGYPPEAAPSIAAWAAKAYPDQAYRQQVMEWWNVDLQRVREKPPTHSATRTNTITCQDGSTKSVEITFSIAGDRLYAIFNDVTQRQRDEEALRQSAGRLAILHEIDQAILSAQSITAIAEAALSHFQQILPRRDSQVILFEAHEAIVIACCQDHGAVQAGRRIPLEHLGPAAALPPGQLYTVHDLLQLSAPSPSEQELLESGARSSLDVPLVVLGESIGLLRLSAPEPAAFPDELIEVAREAADQLAVAIQNARLLEQAQRHARELEDRVAERTRELAEANEQLTELDRLKSKFVSDVSHELRTPIANLKLYIDLLSHGQPDKQAQYIATLQQQIRRVAELVDDILDLSRLERRKQQGITLEKIQLNDIATQVITAYQPRAEALALTLSFMPQADLPPVHGDANQLAQVVTNLIANALNYTQHGAVRVRTVERDNQAGLQVIDTGRGIAPDDLPHIFERFYRGRHTRRADVPGTGLGLAIVKEIVDIHHGQIEVESQVDHGTTISVWLPLYRPA